MTPRVLAGDDEPLVVETDEVAEVLGPRRGPDHGENAGGVQPVLALIAADDRDRLEPIAAVEGCHLASLPDLNIAGGFDPVNEVARHRRGQRSSHDEIDPPRVGGQVDNRLSGRVAATDYNNVFARGLEGVEVSRGVVKAPALEALGCFGRQAAIVGTDREDDEVRAYALTVGEHQRPQA